MKTLENIFAAAVGGIAGLALGLPAHIAFGVFAGLFLLFIMLDVLFETFRKK
jgi:hypothetical protein